MQIDSIVCHYRYGCRFDLLSSEREKSRLQRLGNRFEAYTANDLLAELISLRLNLEGLTTYGTDNCSLVCISATRTRSAPLSKDDVSIQRDVHSRAKEINHPDGYLLFDQPIRALGTAARR